MKLSITSIRHPVTVCCLLFIPFPRDMQRLVDNFQGSTYCVDHIGRETRWHLQSSNKYQLPNLFQSGSGWPASYLGISLKSIYCGLSPKVIYSAAAATLDIIQCRWTMNQYFSFKSFCAFQKGWSFLWQEFLAKRSHASVSSLHH